MSSGAGGVGRRGERWSSRGFCLGVLRQRHHQSWAGELQRVTKGDKIMSGATASCWRTAPVPDVLQEAQESKRTQTQPMMPGWSAAPLRSIRFGCETTSTVARPEPVIWNLSFGPRRWVNDQLFWRPSYFLSGVSARLPALSLPDMCRCALILPWRARQQ